MKRVIVVVFDQVQTLDATGAAEVFAATRWHGEQVYEVEFASRGGGERVTSSSLRMQTRDLLDLRLRRTDTIVVAGADEPAISQARQDQALVSFLARAASKVERMTSICSGAFLLAAAGILDGKTAATHWLV
jgi:transcriptional regulator GlxA family with amidase domain